MEKKMTDLELENFINGIVGIDNDAKIFIPVLIIISLVLGIFTYIGLFAIIPLFTYVYYIYSKRNKTKKELMTLGKRFLSLNLMDLKECKEGVRLLKEINSNNGFELKKKFITSCHPTAEEFISYFKTIRDPDLVEKYKYLISNSYIELYMDRFDKLVNGFDLLLQYLELQKSKGVEVMWNYDTPLDYLCRCINRKDNA